LKRRDATRTRVVIVIPVFNEARVLPRTFAEIAAVLTPQDVDWSVLFVNDGSRDDSGIVLETLYCADRRVSYLTLSRNFGHQAALGAGFDHVVAAAVITMDADLQHPPSLLPVMLNAWREGYDVVHTQKVATKGVSRLQLLVASMSYALVTRVAQVPLVPHGSDFRLVDSAVATALSMLPETDRAWIFGDTARTVFRIRAAR